MKYSFLVMGSVVVFLLMSWPGAAQPDTPPTHVIVISLDGTRPDAIQQIDAPNILALAHRGAFSWTARTVFPPATLPAHASLLSGLDPAVHGADDNVVRPCGEFDFPTFLTLAEDAGYQTAMVVGKAPLCQFHTDDETTFVLAYEGDRSVVDSVIDLLHEDYTVIWAHFPNPDYFGHLYGWMSDTYLYELKNTDFQIGRILTEIDNLGVTDETLIFLTADHGGHDDEHGQDIPEDMLIPWIMVGPGVQQDFDLADTALENVNILDIPPTLLWTLGIPIPPEMTGRVVCEAFDQADEPCQDA